MRKTKAGKIDGEAVIHHVIESLGFSAGDYLSDHKDYTDVAKKAATREEVLEHFMKSGDTVAVSAIVIEFFLDDLHNTVHEIMRGGGIDSITNEETKDIAVDYFNSAHYSNKYEKLIDVVGKDEIRQLLGIAK